MTILRSSPVGVSSSKANYTSVTATTKLERNGRRIATVDATKETLANAPSYTWTEKSAMEKIEDPAKNFVSGAETNNSSK